MSLGSVALVGALGCVDAQTDEAEVRPLPPPVATLDTADGAHARFYQLETGGLVMTVTGTVPEGIEGKTPVEVYEKLAAQPAPAALRNLQARIVEARAQRLPSVDPSDTRAIDVRGGNDTNLTGADFTTNWCFPSWATFNLCMTYQTGDAEEQFNGVNSIHSHLNVYTGQTRHELWFGRLPFPSWSRIDLDTPTGSSYVSTFTDANDGSYRVKVLNAALAQYHWSVHGTD
ncbi:MAG TPA: hypothetical protein VFD36_07060 [Kofleriaceae bacterium]|nr:hypothetical protein [Kofleriaceae bacterium]